MNTVIEYRQLLLSLLEPLKPYYSASKARVKLDGGGATYSQDVIELEAFARPLWGLVPFWIGGERDVEFEKIYIEGLTNGSDRTSPDYWGDCSDSDQRFVEMAPIAFALLTCPEIIWEPLSEKAKDNLSSWLYQINDHKLPKCNWYFFRIFVNAALKKLSRKYCKDNLYSDMIFIQSCYKGKGWYVDGVSGRYDYYSAFAMQFYSIIYASIFPEDSFSHRIKNRADEFYKDFILFFSKSGEAVPYGRSQIYRFAQVAFFSAYLWIADKKEYPIIKGIINRNIRYFLSNDILTHDGIMSVGYCYPNLRMTEKYNAPGSPYWSLKAFAFLALPENHEFFKCEEAPLEIEDGSYYIKQPSFLIQRINGDVTLYTTGMLGMRSLGHFTDKYDKFLYSSLFPFSVSQCNEVIEESAPDGMLAFEYDNYVYVRRGSKSFSINSSSIISEWSVPGIEIKTEIKLTKFGHIRRHEIRSNVNATAYDCGLAVNYDSSTKWDEKDSVLTVTWNDRCSKVKGEHLTILKPAPNSNIAYRRTVLPAAVYEIKEGLTVIEDEFEWYRI